MSAPQAGGGFLVGVDIGGTFTDCAVVSPRGQVRTGKVATRPEDRARSFFEAIAEAAEGFGLSLDGLLAKTERIVHGTTTGTNALITRSGSEVGLLTTAGHRDMPHFMNGGGRMVGLPTDRLFDLAHTDKPEALVPKRRIHEVAERVDFEGEVLVDLDEPAARRAVEQLREQGVSAVAISLLWSVRHPDHEARLAEIVRELLPDAFVSCGSELSSRVGEYERTMTSTLNAYIGPLMHRYVGNIEDEAKERGYSGPILYAQCAGGAITAAEARTAPIRTVHSGPVSGTLGSAFLAERLGEPNLIVTDMGGTSFDVSIVRDNRPDVRDVSILERFEVALPMVFLDTIGAGGGSIAWIDESGGLQVGPQSAGADPGPACYGRGGEEPTVTDADVVLGVIDPEHFLHGAMKLDREASEAAIAKVAEPLGLSIEEAAAGINRIIDAKMADLLRRMSVMRGLDPRSFVCFAYGGGGPLHAAAVAREVGVKQLVVPIVHVAPVWSAFGAATATISHVYQDWREHEMPVDSALSADAFARLEREAESQLADEGFPAERTALRRFVRAKYRAQAFDVEVPVDPGEIDAAKVESDFHEVYEELHGAGSGYREGGSTITGFTLRASGISDLPSLTLGDVDATAELSSREVFWAEFGEFRDTQVIRASGPIDGDLEGPALIELPDTVVVLRPGQTAEFDDIGNLRIEIR